MAWGHAKEPYTTCVMMGTWSGDHPPTDENAYFVTAGGSAYAIDRATELPSGKWRFECTRWPIEAVPLPGEVECWWYAWQWRPSPREGDWERIIDAFLKKRRKALGEFPCVGP